MAKKTNTATPTPMKSATPTKLLKADPGRCEGQPEAGQDSCNESCSHQGTGDEGASATRPMTE